MRTTSNAGHSSADSGMSKLLTSAWLTPTATLAFAVLLIWAFRGNNVPVIPDEVGYLSIGNYLANGEAMNLSALASYKFGQGIVLLPAFWLGTTDAEVYRYAVMISCLQTACVPAVLIGIAKRLDIDTDWRLWIASGLVAIFPSYFYQNSVVWPETTFRLFFLVLIYLVATAWRERHSAWWLLLAGCVVWLYALHARALGLIPVVLILLWSARTRDKVTRLAALASVAIIGVGVLAVSYMQSRMVDALWSGTAANDAGQITRMLQSMTTDDGLYRVIVVTVGHAWSLVASSLGLFVIGLLAAWSWMREKARVWPVMLFAGVSSAIIFAASVAQMIGFQRIDHVIYSRYNDGASTFFVWLGLLAALRALPLAKNASLVACTVILTLGLSENYLAAGYPLDGIVAPNVPAFIWAGSVVPSPTLTVFLLLGTAAAIIVSLMFFALPRGAALALLVVFVGRSDLIVKRSAWAAHQGREGYLAITAEAYGHVSGTVFWDRSAAGYGDNVIDQYMAVSRPMPWSDIQQTDIDVGDATVVDSAVKKDGYACVARLPNNAKLLLRGSGPDAC